MKRAASLLFFLLLASGFAQVRIPMDTFSQATAGCPVIMQAAFVRPARLVLAAGSSDLAPSVNLQFTRQTVKPIKSVAIAVRVLYSEGRYQLDASTKEIPFTLPNPFADNVTSKEWSPASIKLPQNVFRIDRVILDRIDYQDGSTWSSLKEDGSERCQYRLRSSTTLVAR